MKDFIANKLVTVIIVIATIILAGVAVFTAIRLYQLRGETVSPASPESEPAAWNCTLYTFMVDSQGKVTAANNSSNNEPPQQAKVYIDGQLVTTLSVPTLAAGQSATIGTVDVPASFSWRVEGTLDCQSSGESSQPQGGQACEVLAFSLTEATPTVTPTATATPTSSPTPTDIPGTTPTNSPTPTVSPTPTDKPLGGTSPTPTTPLTATPTTEVAATGDTLPDAGIPVPTIIGFAGGTLLLLLALALAL